MSWLSIAAPIVGGLLGAKSGGSQQQQTQTRELDPRMAQFVYGQNGQPGFLGDVQNLYRQQMAQGGLNPLQQEGLDRQAQFLRSESFSQPMNFMRNLGMNLMGGGVAANPFMPQGMAGGMGGAGMAAPMPSAPSLPAFQYQPSAPAPAPAAQPAAPAPAPAAPMGELPGWVRSYLQAVGGVRGLDVNAPGGAQVMAELQRLGYAGTGAGGGAMGAMDGNGALSAGMPGSPMDALAMAQLAEAIGSPAGRAIAGGMFGPLGALAALGIGQMDGGLSMGQNVGASNPDSWGGEGYGSPTGSDDSGGGWGGEGMGFYKGGEVKKAKLLPIKPNAKDDGMAGLQDGEYVVKRKVAKRVGKQKMDALNEGRARVVVRKKG